MNIANKKPDINPTNPTLALASGRILWLFLESGHISAKGAIETALKKSKELAGIPTRQLKYAEILT